MRRRDSPVVRHAGGPLDEAAKESYARTGYLLLQRVVDPVTLVTLQEEAERLAGIATDSKIRERDGQTVRSVFNVHNLSQIVAERVLRNPRLLDIAEQILGKGVYVHQCHINFKRPHTGGEYFWHSDFTFWYWEDGMREPRALTFFVFLDEQKTENGPLFVVPGSHLWITHTSWQREVADHSKAVKHDLVAEPAKNGLIDLQTLRFLTAENPITTVLADAGDVLLADANLAHASGPNFSCTSRRVLLVILNNVENRIGVPFSGEPPRPDYISSRTFTRLR